MGPPCVLSLEPPLLLYIAQPYTPCSSYILRVPSIRFAYEAIIKGVFMQCVKEAIVRLYNVLNVVQVNGY